MYNRVYASQAGLTSFSLPGRNRAAEIPFCRAAEIPFCPSFSPMGRNCLNCLFLYVFTEAAHYIAAKSEGCQPNHFGLGLRLGLGLGYGLGRM